MLEKLKSYSFKQRTIGLVALLPVLGWIAWTLALGDTVAQMASAHQMEQELARLEQATRQMSSLQAEMNQLDAMLGKSSESASVVQQHLLEKVSAYCQRERLRLRAFPAPEDQTENSYLVSTTRFEVEGPFIPLLRLAEELEMHFPMARLASVSYRSKVDRKTKKTQLHAAFALQNVARAN